MSLFRFIVNPTAGRGRVAKVLGELREEILTAQLQHTVEITRGPGDARLLAARASKDDIVVAVGGDGTVNEAVNGVVESKATLATIALGSGNDFARMLRVRPGINGLREYLTQGLRRQIDLGWIEFVRKDGSKSSRYFANGLGIGFDAQVSIQSGRIKYLRGLPLYLLALLRTLPRYSAGKFHVEIDGQIDERMCFLIYIGNGAYEGGGFKLTPDASINDGLLDVCMIDPVSITRALRVLPGAIKGLHVRQPEVSLWKGTRIVVTGYSPFPAHVDGEIIGDDLVSLSVAMIPGRLNVITWGGDGAGSPP